MQILFYSCFSSFVTSIVSNGTNYIQSMSQPLFCIAGISVYSEGRLAIFLTSLKLIYLKHTKLRGYSPEAIKMQNT